MTLDFQDVYDLEEGYNSIKVDSELSPTSTNPVQNKVLYPKLNGVLPAGTVISVKLDGTGDFTTLADAVASLEGKTSTGRIIIELGAGTFTENATITLDNEVFSIPLLEIKGQGVASTTVNEVRINGRNKANIKLHGIKFVGGTITRFTDISNSNLTIFDVDINSYSLGICSYVGGNILLTKESGTIAINNTTTAVLAEGGGNIYSQYVVPMVMNTVTDGWKVTYGGTIRVLTPSVTYTSVTNKVSQTVGTATADGWITGITEPA